MCPLGFLTDKSDLHAPDDCPDLIRTVGHERTFLMSSPVTCSLGEKATTLRFKVTHPFLGRYDCFQKRVHMHTHTHSQAWGMSFLPRHLQVSSQSPPPASQDSCPQSSWTHADLLCRGQGTCAHLDHRGVRVL